MTKDNSKYHPELHPKNIGPKEQLSTYHGPNNDLDNVLNTLSCPILKQLLDEEMTKQGWRKNKKLYYQIRTVENMLQRCLYTGDTPQGSEFWKFIHDNVSLRKYEHVKHLDKSK